MGGCPRSADPRRKFGFWLKNSTAVRNLQSSGLRISGGGVSRLYRHWSTVANTSPSNNEPATNHRSHGVIAIPTIHRMAVTAPPRVPRIPSLFSRGLGFLWKVRSHRRKDLPRLRGLLCFRELKRGPLCLRFFLRRLPLRLDLQDVRHWIHLPVPPVAEGESTLAELANRQHSSP